MIGLLLEIPGYFRIIAIFLLNFGRQLGEWDFHNSTGEIEHDPSGSTRLILACLYSLPSIVLKSSASAIDANNAAKIASVVWQWLMRRIVPLLLSTRGNDKLI
ncbi:MAG: hypothetical protein DME99_10855 [Verrucomicrobia bacterium]|nr:MAG: hypothetical protein DME99_10855 [Verrucomicrobiota bacterium]